MSSVARPLEPPENQDTGGPVEVSVEPPADDSLTINLGGDDDEPDISEHRFESNLADFMDADELSKLGQELVSDFEDDKRSRAEWERSLHEGLNLLGLTFEDRTIPWQGACGVYHPLLTETLVRFQAQAIMELFPASGPARTQMVGESTADKQKLADRMEDELNFILTEKMHDYRAETEQMLLRLGLVGSSFRKIYYDPTRKMCAAQYVSAEDFVVSYGTTDLRSCPRATHVMRKTCNEVKKMQALGFYRDVDLPAPRPELSKLEEKYDQLMGQRSLDLDDRHRLLEMCVDSDLAGFEDTQLGGKKSGIELPYVITVDWQSKEVLSIYRNWEPDDPYKHRRQYFTQWQYLPGLGFYGIGLVHLVGGMAKSATSILRQLVDAGTLNNLPGGLKSRGLRIKGDSSPIMPGEFRDVDIPSGAIRDNIMTLPYKEPSQVLFNLLGTIVQEAKSMGAVADLTVAESNPQAPVGTTLALLERQMKVMSAVQARLHASLKQELRMICAVIATDMDSTYFTCPDPSLNRKQDFSSSQVMVLPVSDPNASTSGQRILQYQAAMQMAQQAPMLFDLPDLARGALNAYGIRGSGDLVKDPEDIKPMDPVTENMSVMNGKPVKAFLWQDHDAHIAVHMAAMQDPKMSQMVGQNPRAPIIMGAAAAHIMEHLAFKYRSDIEKQLGTQLPPPDKPLPPEIEVQLSKLVAAAAAKLFQKDQTEAAQQQAMQQAKDPVIQMQQQELALKQQELQLKQQIADSKNQMDRLELLIKAAEGKSKEAIDMAKIQSEERKTGLQIGQQTGAAILQHKSSEHSTAIGAVTDIAKHVIPKAENPKPEGGE